MEKVRVGVIGAGGYGGCGAVEILSRHPFVELKALIDKQDVGKPISELYPHLEGFCNLPILSPDDLIPPADLDVVLFATPDGVGQKEAPSWLDNGVKVIDYSGDFRFSDPELYKGYAERIGRQPGHSSPHLLKEAVYGLAELHRREIARTRLVGNPGCFAVSCILGLAPVLKEGLIEPIGIVCDVKTGVSGAGKNPSPTFHYPARYEAMNAYKISGHQHVYEIERELSLVAGREINITFTPHVVPLCRGIMSTLYAKLGQGVSLRDVEEAYWSSYKEEGFIRLYGHQRPLISTHVRGSNFCALSLNVDERTGMLIVVSHIDNLVKGQAGSAVQNMNIMFGLPEDAGLNYPGRYP